MVAVTLEDNHSSYSQSHLGRLGSMPALFRAIALPQWPPGHWEHLCPGGMQWGISLFGKKVQSLPPGGGGNPVTGVPSQRAEVLSNHPRPSCENTSLSGHPARGEAESTRFLMVTCRS